MNGPWTLQPGTDSSSSRRQTFGLWWRQKRGLILSTTASPGLLGSRLCLNLNFRICVYLIHEHLAEFWLSSHCLPCIVKPLVFFESWTTSMFAPNICFEFFPGPLESDFSYICIPSLPHTWHSKIRDSCYVAFYKRQYGREGSTRDFTTRKV